MGCSDPQIVMSVGEAVANISKHPKPQKKREKKKNIVKFEPQITESFLKSYIFCILSLLLITVRQA